MELNLKYIINKHVDKQVDELKSNITADINQSLIHENLLNFNKLLNIRHKVKRVFDVNKLDLDDYYINQLYKTIINNRKSNNDEMDFSIKNSVRFEVLEYDVVITNIGITLKFTFITNPATFDNTLVEFSCEDSGKPISITNLTKKRILYNLKHYEKKYAISSNLSIFDAGLNVVNVIIQILFYIKGVFYAEQNPN
jgi:hypothetical protein